MSAKTYLQEIRKQQALIHALEQKAEVIRARAEGMKAITYDRDKVQVSPESRMEDLVVRLVEIEERIGAELVKYHEALDVRLRQIRELPPDCAEILIQRYVMTGPKGEPLTWEQIAVNIARSFSYVTHMHGVALQEFSRRFPKVCKHLQ